MNGQFDLAYPASRSGGYEHHVRHEDLARNEVDGALLPNRALRGLEHFEGPTFIPLVCAGWCVLILSIK